MAGATAKPMAIGACMSTISERRRLDHAIDELRQQISSIVDRMPGAEMSLLDQLWFMITNRVGSMAEGYTAHSRRRLLINTTALDLYSQVEAAYTKCPDVVLRIMWLDCLTWNDSYQVKDETVRVTRFATSIRELVEPMRRLHLRDGRGK